jgi:methionyl-tRNA formyltransferase
MSDDGRKVVLFALTGFGNEALRSLVEAGHKVELLVTREESGNFPYYQEENIVETAQKLNVDFVFEPPKKLSDQIAKIAPDLILSATYHRIIPNEIIRMARFAINIHPSLLPKYKGPTPIEWVLYNNESTTGLSAHFLTDKVDGGGVVLQREVDVDAFDTNGTLRKKMASQLKSFIPQLMTDLWVSRAPKKISDSDTRSPGCKDQDNYYPNFRQKFSNFLDIDDAAFLHFFRALTPYPGVLINSNGRELLVLEVRRENFADCNFVLDRKNSESLYLKISRHQSL